MWTIIAANANEALLLIHEVMTLSECYKQGREIGVGAEGNSGSEDTAWPRCIESKAKVFDCLLEK